MYKTKKDLQKRVAEHYKHIETHCETESLGELFGVFLEGSQNYVDELFFEESDVDTLAVVVPSKEKILLQKDLAPFEINLENGEKIKVASIYFYMRQLKKAGINFQQSLFTEYYKVNMKYEEFYKSLVKTRERIVLENRYGTLMAVMSTSINSLRLLQKTNGGECEVEQFGFSRKRLSNIVRLHKMAEYLLEGKSFERSLKALDEKEIYAIRKTDKYLKMPLEEVLSLAEQLNGELKEKVDKYENESRDEGVKLFLDELTCEVISKKLGLKENVDKYEKESQNEDLKLLLDKLPCLLISKNL